MLIVFDQATPVPIRPYLEGHTVRTAAQQGWDKLRNGDLLTAAEEAGFDILLTTDKNIRFQQNLAGRKIAVVVLGQQQWPRLRPHIQRVIEAVNAATPGSFAEVDIPASEAPALSHKGSSCGTNLSGEKLGSIPCFPECFPRVALVTTAARSVISDRLR
ncbi:MAG: hypothetical protein ABSF62_18760 [Bryobacteraceae bacterium]|jgi:hypothetical protein